MVAARAGPWLKGSGVSGLKLVRPAAEHLPAYREALRAAGAAGEE